MLACWLGADGRERAGGKGVPTESVEGAHEVAVGGLVIVVALLAVAVHHGCGSVLSTCEFI